MRVNKGLFAILPIFLLGVLLLSSFSSAVWPFTGNAVESGSRPTITSTSPSDDTIRIGAHQLISASFSASDPDADMNNLWMQVWKQKSTSNLGDFFTPASGYNNPSGFYTGSPQGTTTANSGTFTFSLYPAGTYYLRFAVRDVASTTLTEEWKTIIVGEKGSVCGANDQCMSGLECKNQICNDPSSSTQISNVCHACNANTQCGSGMFCDSGVCRYNKGNVGEGCWLVPEGRPANPDNLCSDSSYLKPCSAGLTCTYSETWRLVFGFLGTQGTCQQLNVSLGNSCGANVLCASGLKCDSGTSKCIIENAQKPRLFSLTYSATSVNQGTSIDYYIEANKGTADLARHRLYVEGSQGGAWTNLTGSSRNEAVLDTTISTEANPRSFYRGPGEYYLVYEVEDAYGLMSSSRTKVVLRPAAGVEFPRVLEFDVTSSSRVTEGTSLTVYAKSRAGTYPLSNHRLYVAGSNDGKGSQWTPIDSSSSEVTVNTTIPTSRNPLSFYRGPGRYTLIYEINDTSGAITSSTYDVEIVERTVAMSDSAASSVSCSDSDGGSNYNFKGTVSVVRSDVPPFTVSDLCGTVTSDDERIVESCAGPECWLEERICVGHVESKEEIPCPLGCFNGACRTSPLVQTNSTVGADDHPIINSLDVSSHQIIQGENLFVSASSNAASGQTLKRHRLYIFGSQGGEWTNLTAGTTSASINSSAPIPTFENSRSFYKGIGQYTLRYEVEDMDSQVSATEKNITILSPSSVTTASQGSAVSATTTNAPSSTGTSTGSEGSSSASQCSNGCLALNLQTCYQVGYRFDGKFCDGTSKAVVQQKVAGLSCNNGFECSSNVCAANQCVDAGVFARLLAWFEANF